MRNITVHHVPALEVGGNHCHMRASFCQKANTVEDPKNKYDLPPFALKFELTVNKIGINAHILLITYFIAV